MIISASYKTDIPAFYGRWFLNRLDAGYCRVLNPFNQKPFTVSLKPQDVEGFVFWTKNALPFGGALEEVKRRGFPFIVQYTINGYPRVLEYSVVDAEKSVACFRSIADRFGPDVPVWRYDTIVFSSVTPPEFHLRKFEELARKLRGSTNEVVLSFAQLYRKTRTNMDHASQEAGFEWWDPSDREKLNLLAQLVLIARSEGIQVTMCSQKAYLTPDVPEARCVDARRLSRVGHRALDAKLKGNRDECGCYESRDIGDYDTCPHGCTYCYAVRNRDLALKRYAKHDPEGEFLFPVDIPELKDFNAPDSQLSLI